MKCLTPAGARNLSRSIFFFALSSLLLFEALSAVSGCGARRPAPQPEVSAQDERLEFAVYTVRPRDITRDIEGFGNLVAFDKATVVSRIDGIVEKVLVQKGERVARGQEIMEVSNYQLELEKLKAEKEVLSAREELEAAKMQNSEEERNLYKKFLQIEKMELEIKHYEKEIQYLSEHIERKRLLYAKGGITEEEIRNLEFSLESKKREKEILSKEYELAGYGFRDEDLLKEGHTVPDDVEERRRLIIAMNTKVLRKQVEFAEIRLKKVMIELDRIDWLIAKGVITAPIDGIVTEVTKHVGEKVSSDEAITTILAGGSLTARAAFPETDLPLIQKGRMALVFIDSLGREEKASIYAVDPFVDAETRSVSVDCLVQSAVGLVPGMFVRVVIPVKKLDKVLIIPKRACISERSGQGYVYIVSYSDRIFKRTVIVEDYDGEHVIVSDGLSDGDVIVQNPLMNLMDGMKIRYK